MLTLEQQLSKAVSAKDIAGVLESIQEASDDTTNRLEKMVSDGRLAQAHSLKLLDLLRTQLATALSGSRGLSSNLESASMVSTRISSKVRAIEREHSRVKEALEYLENVMVLKTSILGMRDAMDSRDWERAAKFVSNARELPDKLVDGQFAKQMVPTSEIPDYPRETLTVTCEALASIFIREFDKAGKARDTENLTKYFRLFPLIGRDIDGLDIYAKFMCGVLTSMNRTLLQSRASSAPSGADPASGSMIYGFAMSRLFENIASIISQNSPMVETHYGRGRMALVIDRIQTEADSQGGIIIDTFWDERRVDRYLSDVKTYPYSFLVSSFTAASRMINRVGSPADTGTPRRSEDQGVDLKLVAGYVGEMSTMLNRWNLYCTFLASKWPTFTGEDVRNESGEWKMPKTIVDSMLYRKVVTRVNPGFEVLATFVFRRSVEKAFELEELPDLNQINSDIPLVTSVVDDVTYVLDTLSKQVVATGQIDLIKNMLTTMRRILESDLIGMIQRKLRDEAPKQQLSGTPARGPTPIGSRRGPVSLLPGLNSGDERKLVIFLIYINDLAVISDYARRIFQSLPLSDNLPFDRDHIEVDEMISALVSSFKARCTDLSTDGIQVVFSTVLRGRLQTAYSSMLRDVDYMLSPTSDTEDHRPDMSVVFDREWRHLMGGFVKIMVQANYFALVDSAAALLSRMLEKWLWSLEGRVNELGAIRLDRDISRVIGIISYERYFLREKFVRVAQIVMIIGFDETEEEPDIEWALSDEERARARAIRVDRASESGF